MKIGRNDPCPCGSGKKYKKCCLKKESPPADLFRLRVRDSYNQLTDRMLKFTAESLDPRNLPLAFETFLLAGSYCAFGFRLHPMSFAETRRPGGAPHESRGDIKPRDGICRAILNGRACDLLRRRKRNVAPVKKATPV